MENNPKLFEILRNIEYKHSKEISENLAKNAQFLFNNNKTTKIHNNFSIHKIFILLPILFLRFCIL